jgi:programmed cell death protein 5
MGGDQDVELEEIRRRKLQELQRQQDYNAQAKQRADVMEAQRQNILRGILTPEARERLGRVKMAYPDVAGQVEDQLVMLAQSGRLNRMIDDETLRDLLGRLVPQRRDIKIQRK